MWMYTHNYENVPIMYCTKYKINKNSSNILQDNISRTMLNVTTWFIDDRQFRGGAWPISRLGLILTVQNWGM